MIYESKERVGTVDCSRFHPVVSKKYDIKSLFVTGMETDELGEELEREKQQHEESQKKDLKVVPQAKIDSNTNFVQKGQYVRIVTRILYKQFVAFRP